MNDSFAASPLQKVGVLGAGAWGTALAQVAAGAGRDVTIWAFEPEVVSAINTQHINALYLPGRPLNPAIAATADLGALGACDVILAAAPAQHMRATLTKLAPLVNGAPIVLCAKGVEQKSLALMSQVLAEAAPGKPAAVLTGPGFAVDVARLLPTATTIACADARAWRADRRHHRHALVPALPDRRPRRRADRRRGENVIALACGVAEGRKLGEGARAALITRGFAEMTRLGLAMGAKAETLNGLCGLGDLVLTCVSRTSRNTSFGIELGEGKSATEILSSRRSVAEGVATAPAVAALAKKFGIEMPICEAIDAVLAGRTSVESAIGALLSRPFRAEGR